MIKLKILKVIHGYPLRYNAGSEVYSQTIVHGLSKAGHEVQVFSRFENPFEPDFSTRIEYDQFDDYKIPLHLVNISRSKDRYQHKKVDQVFGELLDQFQPDVVHIGHLNHLSTSLVFEAKNRGIPILFTLHDYWLICPRGQFMQFNLGDAEPWQACSGQEDSKCAEKCYTRYISGGESSKEDSQYWTQWINKRVEHTNQVMESIDLFHAPAQYLKNRFLNESNIPKHKIKYLDYGFDLQRLSGRKRELDFDKEEVVFGYIGTHIPAKGIHLLIKAFGKTKGKGKLKIWGRSRGETTPWLKELVKELSQEKQDKLVWESEYKNQEIVSQVFNHTDVIIVPSIWVENSPLVIHEAQQLRIPVITADVGGMAEYVKHEENGLLFKHRDIDSLANQMQRLIDEPSLCNQLGERGYLYSENKNIPAIEDHIQDLEKLYQNILEEEA